MSHKNKSNKRHGSSSASRHHQRDLPPAAGNKSNTSKKSMSNQAAMSENKASILTLTGYDLDLSDCAR